jgi:hypothetical protein
MIARHGTERVTAVLDHASSGEIHHPCGYVRRALEQGWKIPVPQSESSNDGMRYVTGRYGAFIEH